MSAIRVDGKACVRCEACVRVCSIAHVFEIHDGVASAVRPEACWGCGQCVSVCPVDAIDHDALPLEKCTLIDRNRMPTADQLVLLLRARRSARTFAERPVSRDVVRDLIHVTRWSPSAQNSQDIDWVAIDDRARITELSKATIDQIRRFVAWGRNPISRLVLRVLFGKEIAQMAARSSRYGDEMLERWAKGSDPLFHNAPVVLIGHARRRRPFARDDAIYAAYNLMLAAEHEGLATCQIGIFQAVLEKSRTMRRMLGLPEDRESEVILVLGYPQHPYRRLVPRRAPELAWNPR
jgi:nitroreductase/NAD-dependent dihydropyrimidine dehydrogenase PreA subunit